MNIHLNKIFKLLILLLISVPAIAQRESNRVDPGQKIFEAQLVEIKKQLNLPEAQEVKLEEIMRNYNNELDYARKMQARGMSFRMNPDSLSDAQAERIILGQIFSGRMFLKIREKYYFELKKILTPKDILKIYGIEQEVNRKLMNEFNRRRE